MRVVTAFLILFTATCARAQVPDENIDQSPFRVGEAVELRGSFGVDPLPLAHTIYHVKETWCLDGFCSIRLREDPDSISFFADQFEVAR